MIRHSNSPASKRRGLTLVELVIVLTILVALGSMVVPVMSDHGQNSRETTTDATLVAVRDALRQYWSDNKYVVLTGNSVADRQWFQVRWLFENPTSSLFDPDTRIGWNGPYLVNQTGTYIVDESRNFTALYGTETDKPLEQDPAVVDSWTASPIITQANYNDIDGFWDVRIVSAGPNGVIDTAPETLTQNLSGASGDDDYVALQLR